MGILIPDVVFAAGLIPGGPEVLVIVGLIVLLFGAKKIPELMRGLGSGIKEFKKAAEDVAEPLEDAKKAVTDATNAAVRESKVKS